MVNNTNPYLILFPHLVPPSFDGGGDLRIVGKPLWDVSVLVKAMLKQARNEDLFYNKHEADPAFEFLLDECIRFDTEKSRQTYERLVLEEGLDIWKSFSRFTDVTEGARFEGSQWCSPDSKNGTASIFDLRPCDSYQFCGYFFHPVTGKERKQEMYLKFSLSIDRKLVVYVSFHPAITRSY